MEGIAHALGAKSGKGPTYMGHGRSYHEAGTLRMGEDSNNAVTNRWGQVYGIDNLFVADASVFPSVGVANPMLTVTAWAYRLADHIVSRLG